MRWLCILALLLGGAWADELADQEPQKADSENAEKPNAGVTEAVKQATQARQKAAREKAANLAKKRKGKYAQKAKPLNEDHASDWAIPGDEASVAKKEPKKLGPDQIWARAAFTEPEDWEQCSREQIKHYHELETQMLQKNGECLTRLDKNIEDVKDVYKRAKHPKCHERIRDLVEELEHFKRVGTEYFSFPRDPYATKNCQTCQLVQKSYRFKEPPGLLNQKALTKEQSEDPTFRATIAFGFLVNPRDSKPQLERLFNLLVHDDHHYYVNIDKQKPTEAEQMKKWFLYNWGEHPSFNVGMSRTILRGGPGVMMSQLDEMNFFIENNITFTHFWHWSGTDYPVRSVDWMAAMLKRNGPFSYGEMFFQWKWRSHRILDEYVIPCYEENDGAGFLFRATWHKARPTPIPFQEYGGQAWILMHYEMARWISKCIFDNDNHDHPFWDSPVCREAPRILDFYTNAWSGEEIFVHLMMANGPFCRNVIGNPLKWMNWGQAAVAEWNRKFSEYPGRSPGIIKPENKNWLDKYGGMNARKVSLEHGEGTLDHFDYLSELHALDNPDYWRPSNDSYTVDYSGWGMKHYSPNTLPGDKPRGTWKRGGGKKGKPGLKKPEGATTKTEGDATKTEGGAEKTDKGEKEEGGHSEL